MKYRAEVDGLRAFAVVPVLMFHAFPDLVPGGYLGVDVFFVISGYLISSVVLNDVASGRFSFRSFYEKRARRLVPALTAVLAATTLAAVFLLLPDPLRRFGRDLSAVAVFMANVSLWWSSDYFAPAAEENPLLHMWSLAVEEQFYFLFPPVLLVLAPRGRRLAALVVGFSFLASLLAAHVTTAEHPELTFYMTPFRSFELLAGALLALFPEVRGFVLRHPVVADIFSWVGLAVLGISYGLWSSRTPTPGLTTLVPSAATVMILLASRPNAGSGWLLSLGPIVHVGLISYSLYLWHHPILALARHHTGGPLSPLLAMSLLCIAGILAHLCWRFVESPFRDPNLVGRRTIFGLMAFGSAGFGAFGMLLYASAGLPQRFSGPAAALLDLQARDRENPADKRCIDGTMPCRIGADERPVVALWGDSQAHATSYALWARLESEGKGGLNLTYAGCLPLNGKTHKPACTKHNAMAKAAALEPSIETVVLMARWPAALLVGGYRKGKGHTESNPEASNVPRTLNEATWLQLQGLVDELVEAGKRVVIVDPIPEPTEDPIVFGVRAHMRGEEPQFADIAQTRAAFLESIEVVIDAFDTLDGVVRVHPVQIFCSDSLCEVATEEGPLYYDHDHFSSIAARRLVENLPL